MTIKELSEEIGVTADILYEYFAHLNEPIERNENFILTEEQYNKAKLSKEQFNTKKIEKGIKGNVKSNKPQSEKDIIKDIQKLKGDNIFKRDNEIDETKFNRLLASPSYKLIKDVLKHNGIEYLMMSGVLVKSRSNPSIGFFEETTHINGNDIFYPNGHTIDRIFIYNPVGLENDEQYHFGVMLASKKERIKRRNPFLLQTTIQKVEKGKRINYQVNALADLKERAEILKKIEVENNEKVARLNTEIQSLDKVYQEEKEKRELELSNDIDKIKRQKEEEYNGIIEEYNETIKLKYNLIQDNEKTLLSLTNDIGENENRLSNILKEKTEMEATVEFLKRKVETCKNLEFLSEQDTKKYIDALSSSPFNTGDLYLDFEADFSSSFPKLVKHIQQYLYHRKNLIYTDFQIKNFLSLIMTNDLVVLSGLSGSGKTQIVKSFAEALGAVAKIIPVKPNWTSSDDLLGYYNPIQSSFLPTPFTEAISEAIQNPNQLYLICLDEMNLARAEYYFADFLSKMEERTEEPEIELYAKHEEELFMSEFKTLLTLIEGAIGGENISSWKDFLETDDIRNRFFELLGNSEQETLLQIHSKMRRRLLDILKFPSTIKIPNNVRFIGAINIDETTNYFSPKILDRVHIVKFENPLLIEDIVSIRMANSAYDVELKPVYVHPSFLGGRAEYPALGSGFITNSLKEFNKDFLIPLSIDFGIRSIRQALNYNNQLSKVIDYDENYIEGLSLNAIINQKILPRFVFDGNEKRSDGESKIEILERLLIAIKEKLTVLEMAQTEGENEYDQGIVAYSYLRTMIDNGQQNNGQINFYS